MDSLLNQEIKGHNEWQNSLIKFNSLREKFKSIGYVLLKKVKVLGKNSEILELNLCVKK